MDAIDEVDTPGKDSAGPEDDESDEDDLDGWKLFSSTTTFTHAMSFPGSR